MSFTGFAFDQLNKQLGKKQERKKLLKGRTPEQQAVIKYLIGGEGGCLSIFSSGLTDEQYDQIVAKAKNQDFKQKALDKLGIDESQVTEIEPVHFEGYVLYGNDFVKLGSDRKYRSSSYQLSWIFFSSTQVYVWQFTFSVADDSRKETTEEYFYKDITNFSTSSDTVEKDVLDKVNCSGTASFSRKTINSTEFRLVVPGEKFRCAMEANEYAERAIQGMKAKLREKKS